VKYHFEVSFHLVYQVVKVLFIEGRSYHPVKAFPQDERSLSGPEQGSKMSLGPGCRSLEKMPTVIEAGGDEIEIPSQAVYVTIVDACYGQPPALRERGCLQAKTEATKVRDFPLIKRVSFTQPHCRIQLGRRHACSVIQYRDMTSVAVPGEFNRYGPGFS
jgi:hypothetical protein